MRAFAAQPDNIIPHLPTPPQPLFLYISLALMSEVGSGREARKAAAAAERAAAAAEKELRRALQAALRTPEPERSAEAQQLLAAHPAAAARLQQAQARQAEHKQRLAETEDSAAEQRDKAQQLARMVAAANGRVLVYTGAGLSTAADIPDYRGPQGAYTRLQRGEALPQVDLLAAEPTRGHMQLAALVRAGAVAHVVSQNCDGLHRRSGVSPDKLSEIHGNR